MATTELTKENFERTVLDNDIVLVDFWAPWCGPCRTFGPVFDAASEQHGDIVFAKVNTEEQQELAGYFDVRSIPTLMVFREKVLIFSKAGALPASSLEKLIAEIRKVDMAEVHRNIAAEKEAREQAEQQGS